MPSFLRISKERMDRPDRSPEFNTSKQIFDYVGRQMVVQSSPLGTVQSLHRELPFVPILVRDNLILSMERQCKECISVRGGNISY
ncbi:hypothetical protein AVEN_212568-1 [Araneus ventricosus]|uniref:Uncharacterized protein n=1 Tax=Araneus ventricosus TaxID=182803 RepID=A0A4Y2PB70_ARAVE|nr:hypothetical protein AVEN_212568-1 [Araneus ventricosus]